MNRKIKTVVQADKEVLSRYKRTEKVRKFQKERLFNNEILSIDTIARTTIS